MKAIFDLERYNVILIGDVYVSPDTMEAAIRSSKLPVGTVKKAFWGTQSKDDFARLQLRIERDGPETADYPQELEQEVEEADIVMTHFCPIPEKLIKKGKKLKAVLTCRGGVEHIDVKAATNNGIMVINVIRNAETVAEFVLGMCISLLRNIAHSHHALRCGEWKKNYFNEGYVKNLSSQTIGLLGAGSVGIAFARYLLALDIPVMVYDPYVDEERIEQAGIGRVQLVSSMEAVFRNADVVSLHMRLTKDNEGIINKDCFSVMKPTAYFVNTARGGLVNYADLIDALQKRLIMGAALDVYEQEPLQADNPLLELDNVLLTPHIAGTTVDAVPQSPLMLMKEVDRMIDAGNIGRIVNYNELKGRGSI